MSTRVKPVRAEGSRAKLVTSVESVRSAQSSKGEIAKPSRLRTPKQEPINGDTAFGPAAFLARAGLGRKILGLKKNEAAYTQGDPSDAIFYLQKGRLKVTVTSAQGQEVATGLLGAGDFLGDDCMISAHRSSSSTRNCDRHERVCTPQD